jgi:hypothetical protein
MLDALEIVTKRFRWTKPLVFIIGVVFLSLFLASIFGLGRIESDIYLIPSVLGVIWSALFFFMVSTFPYVPPKPTKDTKFFEKIKVRFKRGIYHVFSVIFVFLTIALFSLSFKMVGIWRTDF